MGVTLTCPECHGTIRFREDPAGKRCKCPLCEHSFRAPAAAPEDSDAEQGSAPVASKKRRAPPAVPKAAAADDVGEKAKTGQVDGPTTIAITCPECTGTLRFAQDPAGRKCKCPICHHRFRAPENPEEDAPAEEADAPVVKGKRKDRSVVKARRAPEPDSEPPDEEEAEPAAPKAKRKDRPRRKRRPDELPDPDQYPKLQNGFALLGSTWRVLLTDKHLLVFPIFNGLMFALVVAAFFLPLYHFGEGAATFAAFAGFGYRPPWVYGFLFGLGFALHFVRTFFKMGIVHCALLRFTGDDSSLLGGFGGAFLRFPQALAWAVVSSTIGVVLTLIEHTLQYIHKKLGEVVRDLLGKSWGTLTYMVLPIMTAKGGGPFKAIGRSVKLLNETWGEAGESNLGLRRALFLLQLPNFILLVFGICSGSLYVLLPAAALLLLHLAIGAALDTILCAALYRYAVSGKVPRAFDPDLMAVAFAPKLSESSQRFRFEAEAARWRAR
jgi:hypothetical protein